MCSEAFQPAFCFHSLQYGSLYTNAIYDRTHLSGTPVCVLQLFRVTTTLTWKLIAQQTTLPLLYLLFWNKQDEVASDWMCHRKVSDAEAEAVKKNEEKAKVWKTNQPSNSSSVETTPNSSVEIAPKVSQAPASSSEPRSHSSPVNSKTDADDLPSECHVSCLVSIREQPKATRLVNGLMLSLKVDTASTLRYTCDAVWCSNTWLLMLCREI